MCYSKLNSVLLARLLLTWLVFIEMGAILSWKNPGNRGVVFPKMVPLMCKKRSSLTFHAFFSSASLLFEL
jgi:hypothetical protein